jgi:hypothetical protein
MRSASTLPGLSSEPAGEHDPIDLSLKEYLVNDKPRVPIEKLPVPQRRGRHAEWWYSLILLGLAAAGVAVALLVG